MEGMEVINQEFWGGKKVLVTGCTGFKGAWLTIWLNMLGAKIYGYSLEAPTTPSMWEDLQLEKLCEKVAYQDIRDYKKLNTFINEIKPEVIIHMAAQPLVRYSYEHPRETYEVNVMGTVNLLDITRQTNFVKALVNVTTDKCYENKEWIWAYRENEPLGGYDPYSNSKGCSELVTSAFTQSYFNDKHPTAVASARAGNVIGGGDFASDRLIPDLVRSWSRQEKVIIRYPDSIRPWQHVLEPLSGYLTLAEKLYLDGYKYSGGWNFGPNDNEIKTVREVLTSMANLWSNDVVWEQDKNMNYHEAELLRLDCSKARMQLNWQPRWGIDTTLAQLTKWYKAYFAKNQDMLELSKDQINDYMKA